MNVKLSPNVRLIENSLIHTQYGHSVTLSNDMVELLEKVKERVSFDKLKKEYPEDILISILNNLIEQGFLQKEDFPLFETIHPVHCVNLQQETFFGCPLGNLSYDIEESENQQIGFISIPYNMGSVIHSIPNDSPKILRSYSSQVFTLEYNQKGLTKGWYCPNHKRIVGKDLIIKDYGELEVTLNQKLQLNRIKNLAEKVAKSNILPFFIGGDHAITYPIIKGFLEHYEKIQIIQVDAHSDLGINRWGIIEHGSFMKNLMQEEKIHHVYQLGIRGPQDKEDIKSNKLTTLFGKSFKNVTIESIDSTLPTYITFDVDVFDPSIVPGVGYPVPNGWHYKDFLDFIKLFVNNTNVIGIDIVEYNEMYDFGNKIGASTVTHAILDLLVGVVGEK
ncbi:arginase family protein [Geobacillus thermoleovorans]|uniref:arginase family protein n=1 Tax=Geobacillus thermoleovorans TaxID=33941 RepID=UPI00345BCD0C